MFLCGFLLRHQELESVQSLDHSMKQTPPPPTPSLFIAVALNTPAMGYTNKGGKLQLTFIESAKKKTLASISSKAAASLRAASSSLAVLVAVHIFGILRRFVHHQVALDPLTLAPLLLVLLIVGRQHLPAPTPKEPMQGVRGRETGALAPPVRSLASSVADPSNRRRASAARLFVTSKQTPMCVRLCPGENRRD